MVRHYQKRVVPYKNHKINLFFTLQAMVCCGGGWWVDPVTGALLDHTRHISSTCRAVNIAAVRGGGFVVYSENICMVSDVLCYFSQLLPGIVLRTEEVGRRAACLRLSYWAELELWGRW